nr:HlyD family efflux transporter periplasmic adaptor subunit [Kofleriaceae bacterium]
EQMTAVAPRPQPKLDLPPPTPEDGATVFAMIRRVALQTDLANAVGVLHKSLGEQLDARVVLALINDAGTIWSPADAELRFVAQVIRLDAMEKAAKHHQIGAMERVLVCPISGGTTAGVLVALRRNDRPPFGPRELGALGAAAAQIGPLLGHYVAGHTERQAQASVDAKSIYRPEALRHARDKNPAGALVQLSPRWVKYAYPAVLGLIVILVVIAALVQIPTYSSGTGVVLIGGEAVSAPFGGTVDELKVERGQRVLPGDLILTLDAEVERKAYKNVEQVYRQQLRSFLFDTTDAGARSSLVSVKAQYQQAENALETKSVRARATGTIGDLRVQRGQPVGGGEQLATIVPDHAEPFVVAFLPGADAARLAVGMELQFELPNYRKSREMLPIFYVGSEAVSANEAQKEVGAVTAGSFGLPPNVIIVKARLTRTQFEAEGKVFEFKNGMTGAAEVKVASKSFLSSLLPLGD